MITDAPLLQMGYVSKSFGSIRALDVVDFEVLSGEVMALVGENGAGKSTLVKILAGMAVPDYGRIILAGEEVVFGRVTHSERAGIAVVQQESAVVPTMSIADNVFLGNSRRGWIATPRALARAAVPFLLQVGLQDLDPLGRVERLTAAERKLVEVARLLARDAKLLVFDELTETLTAGEIERVEAVVRALRYQGRSIIYVTRRLDEVFELADRVTVFRDGRSSLPVDTGDITRDDLISMMLGGSPASLFPDKGDSTPGEVVLEVRDLLAEGLATPVDLDVRAGEIVGLAGRVGSGAGDTLRAIAGRAPRLSGSVMVAGRSVPSGSQLAAIRSGIGYSSADRRKDGLFPQRSVVENLTSPSLGLVSTAGWMRRRAEQAMSYRVARTFTIDRARFRSPAGALSGASQQKVTLGRWMGAPSRILLVDEPTQGVDVGARAEIYRHLRAAAADGMGIVIASSDIREVLGIADTVVAYFRGDLVSVRDRDRTDPRLLVHEITNPQGRES